MRRRGIGLALLSSLAVLATACGPDAGTSSTPQPLAPGERPWNLVLLQATFVPGLFMTTYAIDLKGRPSGSHWNIVVNLDLVLVDPAGAPDPTTAGSHAAVDTKCDNNGEGTLNAVVIELPPQADISETKHLTVLSWTHPDAQLSVPPGRYHCMHQLQGPHGHQGLITVMVSDDTFQCTLRYKGTHDGFNYDPEQPAHFPSCLLNSQVTPRPTPTPPIA